MQDRVEGGLHQVDVISQNYSLLVELLLFHIWIPSPCNKMQHASTFLQQVSQPMAGQVYLHETDQICLFSQTQSATLLPADKKQAFSELIQAYTLFLQQKQEQERQEAVSGDEEDEEEDEDDGAVSQKDEGVGGGGAAGKITEAGKRSRGSSKSGQKGKKGRKKKGKKAKGKGGVLALKPADWLRVGGGSILMLLVALLMVRARARIWAAGRAARRPFQDLGKLVFG
jgi:hypothetical protein